MVLDVRVFMRTRGVSMDYVRSGVFQWTDLFGLGALGYVTYLFLGELG